MGKLHRELNSEVVEDLDLSEPVRMQHLMTALRSTKDRQHGRQSQGARCRLVLSRNQGIRGMHECEKPVVAECLWKASGWPQIGNLAPEFIKHAEVWV